MDAFFIMIRNFWVSILSLLDSVTFTINGLRVSYLSIVFVVLITGFVIGIYWRGAKT